MRRETEWCPVASSIAIVFVADPEKDDELPEARLRALYGMTRAEAIVAGVISKGGRHQGRRPRFWVSHRRLPGLISIASLTRRAPRGKPSWPISSARSRPFRAR
jgi:hypothetical protein